MISINFPKKRIKTKSSIIYTNVCSLHTNLELLIANLDHTFDIIGVSETWTPKINQNTQNIKMVPGYQPYCGTKGNSHKGGCSFFVKEGSFCG